jgi:potassium-transporting ATPase KdpC subunit
LVQGRDGAPVGSRLVALAFQRPEHFWPRPSAVDDNASASGGSNLSQGPRLANRRGSSENEIRQLVERLAENNAPSGLGGEPLLNVLLLNLALDEAFPVHER